MRPASGSGWGERPGGGARREPGRTALRAALVLAYGAAGLLHLAAADRFLPIVPDWVPAPRFVVHLTGLCEIAGAVGLATRRWRRAAALSLALYAVCVFPANLKHALEGLDVPPLPTSWWYHGPRLALQPVIVWCALYAGGLLDWPFGRRTALDRSASRGRAGTLD